MTQKVTYYKKPESICIDLSPKEKEWTKLQPKELCDYYCKEIEKKFQKHNYFLRSAVYDDIIPVVNFSRNLYNNELSEEISYYDIYRFISFGHGLVIENIKKEIKGCIFEVGYDTEERTSFSIRLAISPDLGGKDFGTLITTYSNFLAFARGSRIKRGFIEWNNYVQLYTQLNKVGWILDDYFDNIRGMVPTFTAMLPLKSGSIISNRIDNKKIPSFLKKYQNEKDYYMLPIEKHDEIGQLYQEHNFRIAAFVRSGIIDSNNYFLALSNEILKTDL